MIRHEYGTCELLNYDFDAERRIATGQERREFARKHLIPFLRRHDGQATIMQICDEYDMVPVEVANIIEAMPRSLSRKSRWKSRAGINHNPGAETLVVLDRSLL